jgi:biotin carboxylase
VKGALIVLGAKFEQIPMMLKAREMGYETIALDFNERPAGAAHCDHFYRESYSDEDKIAAIAANHRVAGVGTIGTNTAIVVAQRLSERLGLPGLYDPAAVLERAVYKDQWRPVLKENGVAVASGEDCRSLSEAMQVIAAIGYPVLFKPADASGAKGITIARHEDDAVRESFEEAMRFSDAGTVIVERYLGHNSFEIESFVVDGVIHQVATGERTLPPPPICVGLGCTVPDSLSAEARRRVRETNEAAIRALEITYGPVHIDMVLDEDGVPHVIDVGPRLVAGPIGWQHIPKVTGVDMVEAVIKQAVGERVIISPGDTGYYCATRHITANADGILERFEYAAEDFEKHNIMSFEFFAEEGDEIFRLRHSGHRYGFVTAWDRSYEGVCQKIDSFMRKNTFHFKNPAEIEGLAGR